MGNDNQKQFISWLAGRLKVKDQNEFKSKLKSLGDDGIRQAYDEFVKEQSKQVAVAMDGTKLEYLKCLKELKKGGMIKDCGCGGKMKKGGKVDKESKLSLLLNKHQQGGALQALGANANKPLSPTNPLMVEKADGSVGQWGNALPKAPDRQYALAPTSAAGAPGQISETLLNGFRKMPGVTNVIGEPMTTSPGTMPRFGAEASYVLRQLMSKQTLATPPPTGDAVVMQEDGGIVGDGGPRGDGAYKFNASKKTKQLTPHTVVMGQGAGMITSRQQGGAVQRDNTRVASNTPAVKSPWLQKGTDYQNNFMKWGWANSSLANPTEGVAADAMYKQLYGNDPNARLRIQHRPEAPASQQQMFFDQVWYPKNALNAQFDATYNGGDQELATSMAETWKKKQAAIQAASTPKDNTAAVRTMLHLK